MTLDEIQHQLATARDIPEAALRAAVEQAEALAPEMLRLIDLASRHIVLTRPEERLLFYGVHALAAARRTELYEPLLRLIAERSYEVGWLLTDAALHALLISSYAPGSRLPYDLLANPEIHGEVKSDLFLAMAWLVWQGQAPREELVAFLDRFDRDDSIDPDDFAWFGWQAAIALLGLTEFEERMRAGWQAGRMRFDRDVDREGWIEDLHRVARDPANGTIFSQFSAEPISDVFVALRRVAFFGFGRFRREDESDPADPARNIRLITDERQWLEAFLVSEIAPPDTMPLESLDGFLTGLAAGPGDVPREEWWPRIWSEGSEEPEFETDTQEPYVRALIERHLETICLRLKADYRHAPLVDEDSPAEAIEEWAFGFASATIVRPGSWDAIAGHKQAGIAVASITLLLPQEELEAGEEEIEPLDDEARHTVVGNLPQLVRMAYAFWHGLPVTPLVEPRRSQKVGRNEPCPCGSGRKYKKCCGAN